MTTVLINSSLLTLSALSEDGREVQKVIFCLENITSKTCTVERPFLLDLQERAHGVWKSCKVQSVILTSFDCSFISKI